MVDKVVCPKCATVYEFFKTTWSNLGDNITCGQCDTVISGIKEPKLVAPVTTTAVA